MRTPGAVTTRRAPTLWSVVAAIAGLCGLLTALVLASGARADVVSLTVNLSPTSLTAALAGNAAVLPGGTVPSGCYEVSVTNAYPIDAGIGDAGQGAPPGFTIYGSSDGVLLAPTNLDGGMGQESSVTFGPYIFQPGETYTIADTTSGKTVNFTATGTGTVSCSSSSSGPTTTTTAIGSTAVTTTTTGSTTSSPQSPTPPPGYVGFSIDGGAYATDSRSVELDLVWPTGATSALISNDGGFNSAGGTATVPLAPHVPWTLAYTGNDRLPKIVYVRYLGAGIDTQSFTHDIILDHETPSIFNATLLRAGSARSAQAASESRRSYSVRLVAAEDLSGISDLETSAQSKGGSITAFARPGSQGVLALDKVITVRGTAAPGYARVRSAAGMWSPWRAITRQV